MKVNHVNTQEKHQTFQQTPQHVLMFKCQRPLVAAAEMTQRQRRKLGNVIDPQSLQRKEVKINGCLIAAPESTGSSSSLKTWKTETTSSPLIKRTFTAASPNFDMGSTRDCSMGSLRPRRSDDFGMFVTFLKKKKSENIWGQMYNDLSPTLMKITIKQKCELISTWRQPDYEQFGGCLNL